VFCARPAQQRHGSRVGCRRSRPPGARCAVGRYPPTACSGRGRAWRALGTCSRLPEVRQEALRIAHGDDDPAAANRDTRDSHAPRLDQAQIHEALASPNEPDCSMPGDPPADAAHQRPGSLAGPGDLLAGNRLIEERTETAPHDVAADVHPRTGRPPAQRCKEWEPVPCDAHLVTHPAHLHRRRAPADRGCDTRADPDSDRPPARVCRDAAEPMIALLIILPWPVMWRGSDA
jgi:hypothetical protein